MKKTSLKQGIFLVFFGIALGFVTLEMGLRFSGWCILSMQEYSNRKALREKGTYRILCLGESTTAEIFLPRSKISQRFSYPTQLQTILNSNDLGIKFGVINKGVVGTDTRLILLGLEDNLERFRPDLVLVMMGINDGTPYLAWDDAPSNGFDRFINSFRLTKLLKFIQLHGKEKIKEWDSPKSSTVNDDESETFDHLDELESLPFDTTLIKGNELNYWEKMIRDDPHNESLFVNIFKYSPERDLLKELSEKFKEEGSLAIVGAISKKALELNPKAYWAYSHLAAFYNEQGEVDAANKVWEEAVKLFPKDSRLLVCYGQYQRSLGREEEAVKSWNKARKIDPENILAYVFSCAYYLDKNRPEEAKRIFAWGLEKLSDNPALSQILKGEMARVFYEGKHKEPEEYFEELSELGENYFHPTVQDNYQKLKDIILSRNIKLAAMQYPIRSVLPLKRLLGFDKQVIFIDNEKPFKEAVKEKTYSYYFGDSFGGDFGHCTLEGNRLLAQNVSEIILAEIFRG